MGHAGPGGQGRAGCWALQAGGSMGHGVAALAPSHAVPPGMGLRRVHPAWPSGTVPTAVPAGRLQPWGALAGPAQTLVVPMQEQGHCGGVPQACSASWQPTTITPCRGWPEGCPTLTGRSTSQGARSHLHVCPHRAKDGLVSPHPAAAGAGTRGDRNSQHQFVTVRFCQTSPTSFSWALPSGRQKAESPWFEQGR